MRLCAVLLVAACGGPRSPAPARVPPPPARPPAPPITEPQPAPHIELDTSFATVWGYDPNRPAGWSPLTPWSKPERERVASEVPRARRPGRRAPCFAKRDVLVATEVATDLAAYAQYMGDDDKPPPKSRYGTCTIDEHQLRDASGKLVAELGCGITVYVPGIIDSLGFEVGDPGREVAAAHDALDPSRKLICVAEETTHTRCWYTSGDGQEHASHTFAVPHTGDEPLQGSAARAVFDAHPIARFVESNSCH